MTLSAQQLAHVLAALRYCQDHEVDLSGMEHFVDERFGPLDSGDVNALCEELNTVPRLMLPIPDNVPGLVLSFPLPEFQHEADVAVHGGDLASAWHEFLETYLRPKIKWVPAGQPEEATKTLQEVFDKAWDTLRDYGIADLISG